MSRRRKGRDVHGVILLDKPEGYSSNQAVQKVRWLFQARKAGHTGSLDPFATGMLPICLGEASKTAGFMLTSSKTYVATAVIGQATTTGDIEGDICNELPLPDFDSLQITTLFKSFTGEIEQVPPMYSALKHKGQPLYKLAREGKEVDRKSRKVTIHSLELLSWQPPLLEFQVHCSKGTYIRTLAEDIALAMGSCAHLRSLRRLNVEPFLELDMISLDELTDLAEEGGIDSCLLPIDSGLVDWPVVTLDEAETEPFSHGNPVESSAGDPGLVRVYGPNDQILGIGEITDEKRLKPKRLMVFSPQ